jgi:glycosyltransferase involved in cell wall biosynthesis
MKIAQIAPIIERVPPVRYGGTERVVFYLTEELVKRGHDVTLFASGDSKTSAKIDSIYPRALREVKIKDLYGLNSLTLLNIGNAYRRAEEFDIIHEHNGQFALPVANIVKKPVVFTMHGPFTPEVRRVYNVLSNPNVVSISNAQARSAPGINFIDTIYHGMHMEHYPFSGEHDDYLLFVGRISMEKGVHHAIEAAQYLNMPLIIAAKLDEIDLPYFKEYVSPYLSENIKWIGEVDEEKRNELMSRALCFLHPVFLTSLSD